MMNFLDKRKKELGITEADNLNDNVPTPIYLLKPNDDINNGITVTLEYE